MHEVGERGDHEQGGPVDRGRHGQAAARFLTQILERAFGAADFVANAVDVLEVDGAGLGEPHASRAAVEQPAAKARLQRPDAFGNHGLRQLQPGRRSGEGAGLRNRGKLLHASEIAVTTHVTTPRTGPDGVPALIVVLCRTDIPPMASYHGRSAGLYPRRIEPEAPQ